MKKMKKYLLPVIMTFLTIGIFSANAQTSIVGCDGADCTWPKIWAILRTVIRTFLGLVVLFAAFRISSLWLHKEANPEEVGASGKFLNKAIFILIITFLFVALLPITIYGMKSLKVDKRIVEKIECLQKAGPTCPAALLQPQFFTHAYAADLLPQTVDLGTGKNAIYDFFFSAFQLVLRMMFLALVVFIAYSGFALVAARGEPTKLEKAKSRLWYCVSVTVILMLVYTLLLALGDAINK